MVPPRVCHVSRSVLTTAAHLPATAGDAPFLEDLKRTPIHNQPLLHMAVLSIFTVHLMKSSHESAPATANGSHGSAGPTGSAGGAAAAPPGHAGRPGSGCGLSHELLQRSALRSHAFTLLFRFATTVCRSAEAMRPDSPGYPAVLAAAHILLQWLSSTPSAAGVEGADGGPWAGMGKGSAGAQAALLADDQGAAGGHGQRRVSHGHGHAHGSGHSGQGFSGHVPSEEELHWRTEFWAAATRWAVCRCHA